MPIIRFKAILFTISKWTILRLPESASTQLPSRSQVMVKGTINGFYFHTVLEPDGKWGHWLKVTKAMLDATGIKAGDRVELAIEPTKEWPEPDIPKDLRTALAKHPNTQTLWMDVTPMSRWEWIRWITSTKNLETRKHRIEVSLSKLKAGQRRPCCFNRAMCTNPYVSKNGVLLEPLSS